MGVLDYGLVDMGWDVMELRLNATHENREGENLSFLRSWMAKGLV